MNNTVLENVRQRRDIKLLTTGKRSYYLVSELDYDTTKLIKENLLAIEMKNLKYTQINLSIQDFAKLCYMDIVYIKADYIYKDIAQDVETRFDTSNYELDRPLPKAKNKKVIGLMKDELGRIRMIEFVGLRAKTYSYLIDDSSEDKKAKHAK